MLIVTALTSGFWQSNGYANSQSGMPSNSETRTSNVASSLAYAGAAFDPRLIVVKRRVNLTLTEGITPLGDFEQVTLDELFAMSPAERQPYLEAAALALESEYLNNPELTSTLDVIDVYEYPDASAW